MGEGGGALQDKGITSKRSSNVYGGVDYTQRSGNLCGV